MRFKQFSIYQIIEIKYYVIQRSTENMFKFD